MTELMKLDWSDWRRVLVVVAHPDDAEYGLSAAVQMWTRAGVEVSYLLLTHGEAGMQRPPEEAGPLRAAEQAAACAAVGVSDLVMLDYPDGHLTHSAELCRDIARQVRRLRPDVVIATNYDVEAYGGLNQPDHRVAGLATIDGTLAAGNRWVFRDLCEYEGLEPWNPSLLLVAGAARPTHAVGVDERACEAAVSSLACHREYLADLPGHPAPQDFIPAMLTADGELIGERMAVSFRVHQLGGIAAGE